LKFGGIPLNVTLKELILSGTLRLGVSFMTKTPFIQNIDVSFLETPKVDFVLKPLGAIDINKV
jgi:Ca2+-dependent lipid-binding protein